MSDVTKKLLAVSEKAAKAFDASSANLQKTMAEMSAMSTQFQTLCLEVENKESELVELSQELVDAKRRNQVELELAASENKKAMLDSLLSEFGLEAHAAGTVRDLTQQLLEANADVEDKVLSAVSAAQREINLAHASEKAKLVSEHAVATADLKADLKAAEGRIQFLTENNSDLKDMLASERDARVKVAEAAKPNYISGNGAAK